MTAVPLRHRVVLLAALISFTQGATAYAATAKETFQRTVDADIALAEADKAAQDKNLKLARQLYRYARELVPESSDVWHLSARFEIAQNRPEAALPLLGEALRLDPESAPAAYDKAYALVLLEREADATSALKDYRQKNPADKRPAYYLGLYAFKHDDFSSAKNYFDEARGGDERTAAYARSYHALLANKLGDPEGPLYAKQALETAPTEEWKARLAPIAALYTPPAKPRPTWINGRGALGFELDSNATVAPLRQSAVASLGPVSKPIVGARLMASARLVLRPIAREAFTLELQGDFINATHVNRRDVLAVYDFGGPSGLLRMVGRVGQGMKLEYGVDGYFRDLYTSTYQKHFMTAFGAVPYLGLLFAERHVLYALGTFEHHDFIAGSPPAADHDPFDRDGFGASATLLYQVPISALDVYASAGYDQDNTRGTQYFMKGGRALLGLRANLKSVVSLGGFGGVNVRQFLKATPYRSERRLDLGADLRWNIVPYLALTLGYVFSYNDAQPGNATNDAYSYRRHLVSLSLIASF